MLGIFIAYAGELNLNAYRVYFSSVYIANKNHSEAEDQRRRTSETNSPAPYKAESGSACEAFQGFPLHRVEIWYSDTTFSAW